MPSRIAATAADMPLFYQSFNSYAQAIAVKTAAHGLRVSLLPEIWDREDSPVGVTGSGQV